MNKLTVLLTTGEKEVAMRMLFIYLMSARSMGWWDEIHLLIWGPSAKLVADDPEIQEEIDLTLQSGITVEACIGCTTTYGITEKIQSLGIGTRYLGEELTHALKGEGKVITF